MRRRPIIAAGAALAAVSALAIPALLGGRSGSSPVRALAAAASSPLVAPPGFAQWWDGLYSDVVGVLYDTGVPATQKQGASNVPTPAAYDHFIASLPPAQLDSMYTAVVRTDPKWAGLPAQVEHLDTVATAHRLTDASSHVTDRAGGTGTGTVAAGTGGTVGSAVAAASSTAPAPFPPSPAAGSFPPAPAPFVPSPAVAPATGLLNCPPPAPGAYFGDAVIYSANVVADTLAAVATYTPDTEVYPGPTIGGVGIQFIAPNKYRIGLAVAAGAAQIEAAALQFEQASWSNCTVFNYGVYLANVDNTTINTYFLLVSMEGTLNSIQSGLDTIGGQVSNLQQTVDDELTLAIEQALSGPAGSAPNAAYELPASEGGNLDSTPVGVESVVSGAIASARLAGLPVNPAAVRDLAVANAALAAKNYAGAYSEYAAAYREAAQ